MPVNTSANRFALDSLLIFRAKGLTTVAATTGSGSLTLDQLYSYWGVAGNANLQDFAVRAEIEAISAATGTPTAAFSVEIDSDAAFGSAVTVSSAASQTVAGVKTLIVDKEQIAAAIATLAVTTAVPLYIRTKMTVAGGSTTPAISFNAYASPIVGH